MKREHTSAYTATRSKADYLARLYLWFYEMGFKDALDRVKSGQGFERNLPDRVLWDILFRAFRLGKGLVLTGKDLECLPPIDWLWKPYIPQGLVTTVFGNPGVCKSGLCQYIAKRLWEGGKWPNARDIQCKSKTLWLDAEGAKTQVRDRLRDWNMDGEALVLPNQEDIFSDFHINPESDAFVREILEEHQVAMVVVDSLTGVHEENENKAHRMRDLLDIFKRWAEDYNCAVVIVHHPNKKNQLNQSDRLDLDRIRGSSVIQAVVRSVLAVDIVNAGESAVGELHRFYQLKNNLGPRADKDLFFLVKDDGLHFVEPPPSILTAQSGGGKQKDRATQIIRESLATGPKPAKEIEEKLQAEGISEATWKRAKRELGVKSEKDGGGWRWGLPI